LKIFVIIISKWF